MDEKEYLDKYVHEVKNLYSGIYGYSEFIAQGLVDEETTRSMCSKIHGLAKQAAELADKHYMYEMLVKHYYEPKREEISLEQVLGEVLDQENVSVRKREQVLYVSGEEHFKGDSFLLFHLLSQLLQNAWRYGKEEESILISAEREGEYEKIMVCNKCDAPEEDPGEEIYQPFYRIDKIESRKKGGHGLGLAIVKEIATQSGGYTQAAFQRGLFKMTVFWKG